MTEGAIVNVRTSELSNLRTPLPGGDQAAGLRERARPAAIGLRRPGMRTIAITSGKGGVGKSSLAVNLGLALAGQGHRVAIMDGDLGLANVDILLGINPAYDLRHVVSGEKELAEIMVTGPGGLRVIPASSGVASMADLGEADRARLLERLRAAGDVADLLLIDTGAGISRTVLSLVLAADEVLVVTVPEPTAITDAYALIKVVCRERPGLPVRVLLNMVEGAREAQEVYGNLHRIIQRFLKCEAGFAGFVPRDPCVPRAVREQKPLSVYFPYARASQCVAALAADLAAAPARGKATAAPDFWGRVVQYSAQG
jgi:flagellar biosynthesis protein FlhG